MWKIKTWNLNETEAMNAWIEKHKSTMQINTIFVNNAYGVEYRPLRKIY
jgi:hypothetical protein